MKNKRLKISLTAIVILLLIPFVAMQFSGEVNWSLIDFIVMGLLLFGSSFLCELIIEKVSNTKYRIIFCISILAGFLIIWIELAVGIF
ncbi:MAG: hypothetical protein H8E60_00805 [Candidatus Marinimicrobia bacterium]|nr:hypothetical protein [Candidatus Neomarinimicrobiota bacterium]